MGLKKITGRIEPVYEEIIENERKLEATITRSTYEIANPPAEDEVRQALSIVFLVYRTIHLQTFTNVIEIWRYCVFVDALCQVLPKS